MTRTEGRTTSGPEIAAVTARATSPDGLVEVTAGALGDLHELRLDPRHLRRKDADALAASIVATIRAATGEAARAAYRKVAEELPPGTRPDEADLLFGPLLHSLDRRIGDGPGWRR